MLVIILIVALFVIPFILLIKKAGKTNAKVKEKLATERSDELKRRREYSSDISWQETVADTGTDSLISHQNTGNLEQLLESKKVEHPVEKSKREWFNRFPNWLPFGTQPKLPIVSQDQNKTKADKIEQLQEYKKIGVSKETSKSGLHNWLPFGLQSTVQPKLPNNKENNDKQKDPNVPVEEVPEETNTAVKKQTAPLSKPTVQKEGGNLLKTSQANQKDDFDILGEYIAATLRKFPPDIAAEAELEIYQALYFKKLKILTPNSSLENTILPSLPSVPT